MAVNLIETYKEYSKLGSQIADTTISEEEYKEIKNKLISIHPLIEEMVVAAMTRDTTLLANAYTILNINTGIATNIGIPMDIKFDVKRGFTLISNPVLLSQCTFNEIIGYYISESGKIILSHPQHFCRLNSNSDEFNHYVLERCSSVEAMEVLKGDIFDKKINSKCAMPKIGLYNKNTFEIECGNRSLNYTYNAKNQSFDNIFKFGKNYIKPNAGYILAGLKKCGGTNGAVENIERFEDIDTNTHNFEGNQQHEIENTTKNILRVIETSMPDKGSIPNAYREAIDEIINRKPVLKWERDFESGVSTTPTDRRYTKTRPNRRQIHRIDLSGTVMEYAGNKAVVAIDTSGSISTEDVKRILSEAYNITQKYHCELTVIECDSRIGRVYDVKNKKDFKLELTGGGGTSFSPVIKYLNDNLKTYRKSTLIYFTDGYGESAIPQPLFRKLIWVILDTETCDDAKSRLSVREPYGVVRAMRKEK